MARFANRNGRFVALSAGGCVDIERATNGRFSSIPERIFEDWEEFLAWLAANELPPGEPFDAGELDAPSPRPRQVFGIGLNYRQHAEESRQPIPDEPLVFAKFPTAITGPTSTISLSGKTVDWEAEVVVVMGRRAHRVPASEAWTYVAGITAGQDVSDRERQWKPRELPQFNLGKSYPGYGPIGPVLATPDEYSNKDDISLTCLLNGEVVQKASTGDLIFSVPALIEHLSSIVPLLPGDLIFTGTPAGIGATMRPPRFLTESDELRTSVEGAGEMCHHFVSE